MRNIEISSPYGQELKFVELQGKEALSSLYNFQLTLTSTNPNLSGEDIIGQISSIHIQSTDNITRHLNGLVTDFGYLHEDPDELDYHLY